MQPHVPDRVLARTKRVLTGEIGPDRTNATSNEPLILKHGLGQDDRHNHVLGPIVAALAHEKLPAKVCPVPGTTRRPY